MQINKLILYKEENNKIIEFNSIKFYGGKINVIAGDSESGKSQIIECLKYALNAAKAEIEQELLARKLHAIVLHYKVGEEEYSILRILKRGEKKQLDMQINSHSYYEEIITNGTRGQIATLLDNSLYQHMKVPSFLKELNSNVTNKNLLRYNFYTSDNLRDGRTLIDNTDLHFNGMSVLNMYAFNFFYDDNMIDIAQNFKSSEKEVEFERLKNDINKVKNYLSKSEFYICNNYEKTANFFLESNVSDLYSKLSREILQTEKQLVEHYLLIENYNKYKEVKKNVDSEVYKIVKDWLLPRKKNDPLYESILEEVMQNQDKYSDEILDSSNVIDELEKKISRLKKKKQDQLSNMNFTQTSYEEIVNTLEKISDLSLLDFKPSKEFSQNEKVKIKSSEIEEELEAQIEMWYDILSTTNDNYMSYKILDNKLLVKMNDEEGKEVKINFTETGSDWKKTKRKLSIILPLIYNSKNLLPLLVLDQPLSKLNDTKNGDIEKFYNCLTDYFIDNKFQIIIIDNIDYVSKVENSKIKIVKTLTKENPLVPLNT